MEVTMIVLEKEIIIPDGYRIAPNPTFWLSREPDNMYFIVTRSYGVLNKLEISKLEMQLNDLVVKEDELIDVIESLEIKTHLYSLSSKFKCDSKFLISIVEDLVSFRDISSDIIPRKRGFSYTEGEPDVYSVSTRTHILKCSLLIFYKSSDQSKTF
jgi:hypothetical protein